MIKTVLFFDICSSSAVLEYLHSKGEEFTWKNLIIGLSEFLNEYVDKDLFEIYQFQGDGWILIINDNNNYEQTFIFLENLCQWYHEEYDSKIRPILQNKVKPIGITFGMDMGKIYQLELNGKNEYWGRCFNVASRLQTSIKDNDKQPQYKLLITNDYYKPLSKYLRSRYDVIRARRKLRNIHEDIREYKKIVIMPLKTYK